MEENIFKDLPFLVQPDNVARFEDNKVFILDRRIYPFERKFVQCDDYQQVAEAIRDMVTQSYGPLYSVSYGMVLAAHSAGNKPSKQQIGIMESAARTLGSARPTNNSIAYQTAFMLNQAKKAISEGLDVKSLMLELVGRLFNEEYAKAYTIGRHAADLLESGYGVLNHCWAETTIVYTMLEAKKQGKDIEAFCDETRPYLQGARLTADAISEIGVPTTVICDNMPGSLMQQGKINIFFSGADRVAMSGHVINKVGTFQAALCADFFGIPYYPFCPAPDKHAKSEKDVAMEERDPNETLYCLKTRTATLGARGLYPAFDVTPPELVKGIITPKGIFPPNEIESFYRQ
ncbi:MAG: s-methyl-5-thioribose-1-phosphate isomerase [Clostridiales bacterium]|jgi:methylthioribose-1-phosphate isomerase|nr:s-methyl-5-thioribose-1-phosphate isomerase [Clostridiales bacterium]